MSLKLIEQSLVPKILMNSFVKGPILFVGEGDFSLALSLRKTLSRDIDIFASTLLSESDVCSLHRNSEANINSLRNQGVYFFPLRENHSCAYLRRLFL